MYNISSQTIPNFNKPQQYIVIPDFKKPQQFLRRP